MPMDQGFRERKKRKRKKEKKKKEKNEKMKKRIKKKSETDYITSEPVGRPQSPQTCSEARHSLHT